MLTRLTLIAVAAVSAVALAACGGGGGQSTTTAATTSQAPDAILAAAATKATNAGSSKIDFSLTTQVPGQEGPVTITGSGAFDYGAQKGELSYDFSQLGAATGQDLGKVDVIADKTTFYLKFPFLSKLVPGGKEWLELDLESLAKAQGTDLAQLGQIDQGDPTQTLNYLRAAGSVEEVGKETLDGVETTHYKAVLDLDKAAQLAPAGVRAEVKKSIEQLKAQTDLSQIPVDVWIDGDGLPRKIEEKLALSLGGDSGDTSTVVTMKFSDYGTPVDVTPPPANQVTDLSALLSLLENAGSNGS